MQAKWLSYVLFALAIGCLGGCAYSAYFEECYWCSAIWVFAAVVLYVTAVVPSYSKFDIKDKHVVITGGSSGIGLSTAILAAKAGGKVTIIARNVKKLEEAREKILAEAKDATVFQYSCDVSDGPNIRAVFEKAKQDVGRGVDVLIMSAGVSIPRHFEDYEDAEFERVMRINYLGSVYSTRAALPQMRENGGGRLIFVSSLGGLCGVTGFTTYSPSKFAVRGLAEVLQMELQPQNIQVSLVNPADVDTPMYEEEMKSKPLACARLSEGSGLFPPEDIAKDILGAIKHWRFMVNTGFDASMMGYLGIGFAPPSSIPGALFEVFGLGLIRAYSLAVIWSFNHITIDSWKEEKKDK